LGEGRLSVPEIFVIKYRFLADIPCMSNSFGIDFTGPGKLSDIVSRVARKRACFFGGDVFSVFEKYVRTHCLYYKSTASKKHQNMWKTKNILNILVYPRCPFWGVLER
jgi:hypothetical protein